MSLICSASAEGGNTLSAEAVIYESTQEQNSAYENLPQFAIVCHVLGVPVYKSDINEYGVIEKNFDSAFAVMRSTGQLETTNLEYPHTDETIYAALTHVYVGYSETNQLTYMHENEATNTAIAFIDDANREFAIAQALGSYGGSVLTTSPYYAGVAAVVGGVLIIDGSTRLSIANNILSTCQSNGNVLLIRAYSQYGTFYSVNNWNGVTVYVPSSYTDSNATITVTSSRCSHGSLS